MKNTSKKLKLIIISFFCLAVLLVSASAFAQSASDLKDKISDKNEEIRKLEAEIKAYQKELEVLGGESSSLKNTIKKLDLTRQKLLTDIKVTESKISNTNLEIEQLSLDIGNKEEKIIQNKSVIAAGLKKLHEMDLHSIIQNLLSQDTLSDLWNEAEALKSVQTKLSEQINELKLIKEDLEINKDEAEEAKRSLVSLKSELGDQKKINDQNTAEKNKLLKDTQNKESNYSAMLKTTIAKKEAFEKELRDYESQLKFILDPSKLPKSGSSALSWPLSKIIITQFFGSGPAAKKLYVSGSHNGVDFGIPLGTQVKSMAGGVVVGTGNTDLACPKASYGQWVLVKHNNGLTSLYAHLSLIKVGAGEAVASGELLGYSGSTGYSTGPHLHISVFASTAVEIKNLPSKACGGKTYTMPVAAINAYLDPMLYLPPYKK